MKALFLLLSAFLFTNQTFAQKEENPRFNTYSNEIGIDIQNIFGSYAGVGVGFIYKKKYGEKKYVTRDSKKFFRFQLRGSGTFQTKGDPVEDALTTRYLIREQYFNSEFLIGIEKQKQKGRIQYFRGIDIGVSFYKNKDFDLSSVIYDNKGGEVGRNYRVYNNQSIGIRNQLFGGFRFFIIPELSLSIETSFDLSYRFAKSKYDILETYNQVTTNVSDRKYQEAGFYFDYLNALFISYYF